MRSNWGGHGVDHLEAQVNLVFLIQPDEHTLKHLIELTVVRQSWGC